MMQIERSNKTSFKVQSGPNIYQVTFDNGLSLCDCPDFVFRQLARNGKCKHILAVEAEYPVVLEENMTGSIEGKPLSGML